MSKDLGDGRNNHFILTDSLGEVNPCSVEEIALDHFIKNKNYIEGTNFEFGIYVSKLLFNLQ